VKNTGASHILSCDYIRTRISASRFLRCCACGGCRGNDTIWCDACTCGDIDGERVANGDRDGEKLGDIAVDALKPTPAVS
jgi:hypothetical protein